MAGRLHWPTEEAYSPGLREPAHLETMLTRQNRNTKAFPGRGERVSWRRECNLFEKKSRFVLFFWVFVLSLESYPRIPKTQACNLAGRFPPSVLRTRMETR